MKKNIIAVVTINHYQFWDFIDEKFGIDRKEIKQIEFQSCRVHTKDSIYVKVSSLENIRGLNIDSVIFHGQYLLIKNFDEIFLYLKIRGVV